MTITPSDLERFQMAAELTLAIAERYPEGFDPNDLPELIEGLLTRRCVSFPDVGKITPSDDLTGAIVQRSKERGTFDTISSKKQ